MQNEAVEAVGPQIRGLLNKSYLWALGTHILQIVALSRTVGGGRYGKNITFFPRGHDP